MQLFLLNQLIFVSAQWEWLSTTDGPSPRRGHSMVTYSDSHNNDILILFGGRSQYFANCTYNNNWNYTACGDHHESKLVDTTIVLSSSDASYPTCALNCSENGWCHYDETISDSYCICYDDYRGPNCQFKEFQEFEYDVWYLNVTTLEWTHYDFVDRENYAYADDWPWPSGRFEHSAIIKDNAMIIYGGYSPKCLDYCNDIWLWDVSASGDNKWSIISYNANDTETLWHHGAFLSNNGNYMYTIAGHRFDTYLIDVMQFNLNTYSWKRMNHSHNAILPPTRIAHAYCAHFDSSMLYPNANPNNLAYIHGGYHSDYDRSNESEFLRYLWSLQVDESNEMVYWNNITYNGLNVTDPMNEILTEWNRWHAVPFPRMDHLMIHIPNSSYLFVFGGYSSNRWFDDLWRFDLNTQIWIKHTPPFFTNISNQTDTEHVSSRAGHQWTYMPSTHSIVLFGGYGNDNKILGVTPHTDYYGDSWILNLNGCKGYAQNNECHKNEEHGYCWYQFCICNDDYWGIGCEFNMCPNSECVYDNHTLLPQCTHCNDHGTCNNGTCVCDSGYGGNDCTKLVCANDCSDRGNCTETSPGDVQCVCNAGFMDSDCGLYACNNDCHGRGVCDHSTGICDCEEPLEPGRKFSSPDCALTLLKSVASEKMTGFTGMSYLVLFIIYIKMHITL
eukprot:869292_1